MRRCFAAFAACSMQQTLLPIPKHGTSSGHSPSPFHRFIVCMLKKINLNAFVFRPKSSNSPHPHTLRHTHTAGALITFYFQILPGNINTYSEVENVLQPSIFASKVRIYPYSQYDRTVCLRAEIVGCAWEGEFPSSLLQLLAMNYS